jgi:L-alanine-DL-glutamate epimerase-like enolase superfamily enzyme
VLTEIPIIRSRRIIVEVIGEDGLEGLAECGTEAERQSSSSGKQINQSEGAAAESVGRILADV